MASGTSPNSDNIARVGRGISQETPVIVHPEYMYWREDWMKLRDVLAGQKEIKRKGQRYLPKMKGMDDDDYMGYLERATFYNMVSQTQTGMLGQVFRKDPSIENLPLKFKDKIRISFAKDGSGHVSFVKTVLAEQIGLGRFGVLVDAPSVPSEIPTSYVVGYSTENILDWETKEVNGLFVLSRVLLREFIREVMPAGSQQNPWIGTPVDPASRAFVPVGKRGTGDGGAARSIAAGKMGAKASFGNNNGRYTDSYTYSTLYRELVLEQVDDGSWVYIQRTYNGDPNAAPTTTAIPMIRGVPLNFIPFKFFGSISNSESVERSPMLDIADLNLSHYRTYAELEYGRLYTALPVYYAPGGDGEAAADYHIGPNTVWEVPKDSKPGILEYTGSGLKALETALTTKESQIAAIGGRLMPGLNKASESGNQTVLREANEQAVLLNCILATGVGMTEVVRWWLMFRDIPLDTTEKLSYTINQEFLSTPIGAREIRAIQLMYSDGLISVEQLYDYLQRAEIVKATTSIDEFKAELRDPDSFINNPDVSARQRGFASRQQELDQATQAREEDMQQAEIDLEERIVVIEEKQPVQPISPPKAQPKLPAKPRGTKVPRPKA